MNDNDTLQEIDYTYLATVVLWTSALMLLGFVTLFGMYLSGAIVLGYILLSKKFKSNYSLLLKTKQPFTKLIVVWRNYILIVGSYVFTTLAGMWVSSYLFKGNVAYLSIAKSNINKLFVPLLATHMVLYFVTAFIMGIFLIVSIVHLASKPLSESRHE